MRRRPITRIPTLYTTITVKQETFDRLRDVKFKGEVWTDFLERLLEEHLAYRHRLIEIGEDFTEMNPLDCLED